MHEEWKPINGFEGLYEISSYGRVKSFKSHPSGKILKTNLDANGYPKISLSKKGAKKDTTVHRLVAETYLPRVDGKTCVNHIDGNKANNRLDNLEWCTYSENIKHAIRTGLYGGISKEATMKGVRRSAQNRTRQVIRSDGARFKNAAEAASAIGAHKDSIYTAIRRKAPLYGYRFSYAD